MGGFDIYVKVNTTYLNPTSAALGTLIASPSLTSICVNGAATTGSCTTGTANGPGVVEVTTIEGSGTNECGGSSPCSGMAFTITYYVVASTPRSPIYYPTAAGCSVSSVSSPANVCVEVADNIGTVLPETTLAGDFTDLTPSANFAARPTTGVAPLTVAFDATTSNATAGHSILFYNWAFGDTTPPANLTSATTSHTYNSPGTYIPNLETQDSSLNKSSIKSGLTITVLSSGFSIGANMTRLSILQGTKRNVTIILTSLNGFSGTVSLSANMSAVITTTLNKTSVIPSASGTPDTSAKLTIATAAVTPLGRYVINVTGVSGILKHSVFIIATVVLGDYSLSNSGPITAIRGKSGTNTINATLTNGTGQPVTLSCIFPPALLSSASCSFIPPTVTPARPAVSSVLTITTTTSTPGGSYSVQVTGNPLGPTTANTTFTFNVADFQISASPPSVSVPQGGNGNSIITFTSQSGFNSNINITSTSASGNIIGFLNRTSLSVTVAKVSNSSTLYIITQTSAAPGSYNIIVTGSVGLLTHSFTVTVNVPVPNFGASATPTSVSVKTGTNGTSVISLLGLNGFTGTISLQAKAPLGNSITAAFSSNSVTITSTSGPVASTLTISTTTATPAGSYTITVNATTTTIYHLVNITLTVISPLPSIQVGAASLSTVSAAAGNRVDMTFTVSNTGTVPVNITVTMDVNSGTGTNVTVAQKTLTISPGVSAQTITLSWNTTQWAGGNYHVYARIIGSQTNTVNQAQSAGNVALTSPPASPGAANLSVIPWITTGILAAIAVVLGLLLFRRRRPTGHPLIRVEYRTKDWPAPA
jgi:PKD repeat protein